MGYSSERAAIETLLNSAWGGSTPIGYDGEAFKPVYNSIRLTILSGKARNASIGAPGSNLARYTGVVAIQVFTKGGEGTSASRDIEDRLSDIFRNKTLGGIRLGVPYVQTSLEEAPFLIRTMMVPFERDEFHG